VHAWLGCDPLLGLLDRALLVTQPPPTTAQAQTPARHCTRTDVRMRELF
jgi:hypothetical protein